MTEPSLAIQDAQEAELRSNALVKAEFRLGNPNVFTLTATKEARFPYIIIGQDQVVGDDTECADSSEVTSDIHIYAREATYPESRAKAKALAGAVKKALTKKLTLAGHVMDDWIHEGTRHLTDPDPTTAHSIVTITYLTTEDA